MQMIPSIPHGTHSQAEKKIFDLLRGSFENSKDDYTAYHSINLTRHAYKRFGEIDFLLCSRKGIFVLEVKGGRIACREGIWIYINRFGESNQSSEGPFRQAESALHGLRSNLKANLTPNLISRFTFGYGVLFPDCVWDIQGVEWDRHVLADARDLKNIERWLGKLIFYWRNRDFTDRKSNSETLKRLKKYLRPEFETAVPLHVQTAKIDDQIAVLTDDQMGMLDIVDANPRVLCSGGAGTGKTFLAMELAKRWTANGFRVSLVCHSPWLKRFLESRFTIPNLTLSLDSSLSVASRRNGLEKYDALIVDEGQDLLTWNSLEALDKFIKNGLEGGKWCFFMDVNNQTGLFGHVDQEALSFLESCRPTMVPLRKNCRNTKKILEKVKSMLGADMGIQGAGEGPDIHYSVVDTMDASANRIEEEIMVITDEGGLLGGELTILSPWDFEKSSVSLLPNEQIKKITILDEYSLRSYPPRKISFSKISSFKGLENEAIIVVDLPLPNKSSESSAEHYVAMSRARALLSLVFRR